MLGGFAGLSGCIILGPRTGRYRPEEGTGRSTRYQRTGVNPALYILGTFLLWFGWYTFNVCSTLSISTAAAANTARRIATNTTLAASSAGVVSIIIVYLRTKSWVMLSICTGTLGGEAALS